MNQLLKNMEIRMAIRDLRNIFNSSLELLDLLLSILLLLTGLYFSMSEFFRIEDLSLVDKIGNKVNVYHLLSEFTDLQYWGFYFFIIGVLQMCRLCWYQKPNPYLNAFIKTNVSFSFLFLGITQFVSFPVLTSTIMFLILSLFSLFSLVKSK